MMAQEAAQREMANSKPGRLQARKHSFKRTEVKAGDSLLAYKSVHRISTPRPRDEAGATANFQGQTF